MVCVRKMTDDAMRSGAAFPAAAAATLPAAQGADAASDRPRHLALPHGAYVFSHDMTWHADVDPWTHQIMEFRSFLRALTNKKQDHERKGRHREPRGSQPSERRRRHS